MIKLKAIEEKSVSHVGYGAGSGDIINEEYECPCGQGKVFYEKDDIPGFRSSDIWCTCKECDDKYTFRRGIAEEKSK
ncbi:hypothetical protein [Metabacillus litoralis]|uniref:hypothetical protein n=1 Tax=Metabacillus litoralis TaxID=152268 RepID=UPI00203B3D75|nr:hypothetical protein [Metabacillus litoralis]MCM3411476.1 hypothetical protein [Metabacillus litoralis]